MATERDGCVPVESLDLSYRELTISRTSSGANNKSIDINIPISIRGTFKRNADCIVKIVLGLRRLSGLLISSEMVVIWPGPQIYNCSR